jgi:hypothetical protein
MSFIQQGHYRPASRRREGRDLEVRQYGFAPAVRIIQGHAALFGTYEK